MITKTAQAIWEAALGEIQVQVSKPNFRTWFEKTVGVSYQENQFVVGVPNTFVAEYLDQNQRSLIEKALIGLTFPDVKVLFQVNGKHPQPEGSPNIELGIPASIKIDQPKFNSKYVFESFIEGNGNRLARNAAWAVSQDPGHSYNPLFIYGGAGLGKTHLLHAIGHVALGHTPVICASAEQFTNEFVTSIRERKTEDFRNKYRNIGMLLIDDIQFIGGKEQTEESFFHTFNELHNANHQIVITSDRPPKAISLLSDRLRSRFEWGLMVDIQAPDFETRLAILQTKARQKEVDISPDIQEFIARQAQRNVRELEGALNRVIAYAKLLKATPTLDLATRALEDIARKEPNDVPITPELIIDMVAESFQLSVDDLRGRQRDKETALARRVAMYLLRRETNCSLAQIGEKLGGRDAAAVTNANKKTVSDIEANPYLKRKIAEIEQKYAQPQKHD